MMTPAAFATGWRTAYETAPVSASLLSPSGLAPFNAGGSLTMQKPTTHQLSQRVDR